MSASESPDHSTTSSKPEQPARSVAPSIPAPPTAGLVRSRWEPDSTLEDIGSMSAMAPAEIRFYRELLRASLEHLSMGVSVVDHELRLVAWNRRYVEMFEYPPGLIVLGRPIGDVMRYNATRGLLSGGSDEEEKIARRLGFMRNGTAYQHEREFPDGIVIEIHGNPMPGGGFVTSYSDVSAYKLAQRQLEEINETLESRVAERTAELVSANAALQEAKAEADRANQAKTRFLASASHDLVQPLNAARLFVSSIDRSALRDSESRKIKQVENSLTAAESLLGALLDISRLDAAAHELKSEHIELARTIEPLAAEFAVLAQERGLEFRVVPSKVVVHTDPRLLRRVLQNFLSNAVRYTRHGRVLMGCRRLKGAVRIEVWDTGPGIPQDKQQEIFEEFRRLGSNQQGDAGLGLGLAIADRLAKLMNHPLGLRSWPGKGSVFSITVPLGERSQIPQPQPLRYRARAEHIEGATVLVIDNETAILEGVQALLGSWGARVVCARDEAAALQLIDADPTPPDVAMVDYHLDEGQNGVQLLARLQERWTRSVPGIVITADHTLQARSAAANTFPVLSKPVKPAALRALLSRVLSQNTGADAQAGAASS